MRNYFTHIKKSKIMPVQTGPSCIANEACPVVPLPLATAVCTPAFSYGGVNDLYFIPCTETMSEANILDVDWWTALVTNGYLGNIGLGLGSIGKKSTTTEKVSSCRPEQIISAVWALKYTIKAFDKTSADATTNQINALLSRYSNFQVIARMCDGDNTVLPIGTFSIGDFDWVVPEDFQALQTVLLEVDWIEFAKPKVYTVTGLSAVVPKA